MDRDAPDHVLIGPARHGVVRYARDLVAALDDAGRPVRVSSLENGEAAVRLAATLERVHIHVTDRVLGRSPEEAADRVEEIGSVTNLSITLHDLPQPSDGTNFARRRQAYDRFMNAAGGVAVNSQYEAQLVEWYLGRVADGVKVIPIGARSVPTPELHAPQPLSPSAAARSVLPLRVLIAGFVYPGKGHREAISAVGALVTRLESEGSRPSEATVVAIGAPSAGHEDDIDGLHQHATRLGVEFRVTGFLNDAAYRAEMSSFGIPLAAHQHVSASRSMVDWLELGRNALVVDSPYGREMSRLRPATMTLYEPGLLAEFLAAAWRDPTLTHLPRGASLAPTLEGTARAYRAWWSGLVQ